MESSKTFPGVVALSDVTLSIERAEVHALVGENGAGKSTLIKIISGIYRPDHGSMTLQDELYSPQSPLDAIRAGVRVIHQELNLLTNLSIAENIHFEKLPSLRGLVDYRAMMQSAEKSAGRRRTRCVASHRGRTARHRPAATH